MIPNMFQENFPLFIFFRYFGKKWAHFRGDLWTMRWSVAPLSGYTRKVEGTYFPLVKVSSQSQPYSWRYWPLKIAFFQTKNCRFRTVPLACPTKISPIVAFFKAFPMMYLNLLEIKNIAINKRK